MKYVYVNGLCFYPNPGVNNILVKPSAKLNLMACLMWEYAIYGDYFIGSQSISGFSNN